MARCKYGVGTGCPSASPAARLKRHGAGVLRNDELVSVLFGITPNEANRILASVGGNLVSLAKRPLSSLVHRSKLDPKRARKVKAWNELCARVNIEAFPRHLSISSPEDLSDVLKRHRLDPKEAFYVAVLDARNQVLDIVKTCDGTVDACAAHPRDIFTPVITEGGSGLILIHNHPSGNPQPSKEDVAMTSRIKEVAKLMGLRMLDHLIVAGDRVVSLRGLGLM
jgi:DNA repair protein RadC